MQPRMENTSVLSVTNFHPGSFIKVHTTTAILILEK